MARVAELLRVKLSAAFRIARRRPEAFGSLRGGACAEQAQGKPRKNL